MGTRTGVLARVRREALTQLTRAVDARTGASYPERVHARWSAHDFAAFSSLLTAGYLAFYILEADSMLGRLVTVNSIALAGHVGAVLLARARRQLASALTAILTSTVQIVTAVAMLGWESGLHLYLIASGVLVFVVFTEKQAPWRWVFIVVAAATFIWCQTVAAPGSERPFAEASLGVMFSINAVATAVLVFALSGLSYHRANRARAEAASAAARAEYLANTDALTGLVNRRPIIEALESESLHGGYVVGIADLDHFKALNDTYGHQCGDLVLAAVAATLRQRLRAVDSVGRWGGEEFIVVLPGTTEDDAMAVMDELRSLIADAEIPCQGHHHRVTVSIGAALGTNDGSPHGVVKRADEALYDAKVAGRNAVRMRSVGPPSDHAAQEDPRAQRTVRARKRAER